MKIKQDKLTTLSWYLSLAAFASIFIVYGFAQYVSRNSFFEIQSFFPAMLLISFLSSGYYLWHHKHNLSVRWVALEWIFYAALSAALWWSGRHGGEVLFVYILVAGVAVTLLLLIQVLGLSFGFSERENPRYWAKIFFSIHMVSIFILSYPFASQLF